MSRSDRGWRTRTVAMGDRGRVPFALVGVVLVVGSALFVAVVDRRAESPEPGVDVAIERTTADARAAFRDAVGDASAAAVSEPVLTPANTSYGDLLGPNRTFRDALRIRTYVAARERFAALDARHRGVDTTVSLPATPNASALGRAMGRVSVSRAGGNGTALRATVENVTVTARRDGRVVGRRNVTLSVVVASPALALHDRVSEYEARMNAGLSDPGFARRLTARLSAIAWARGYAQYGGAPIENVVANRHVELAANGAALGVQRGVFGQSDRDGKRALGVATARVGLTDLAAGTERDNESLDALVDERLRTVTSPAETDGPVSFGGGENDAPDPTEPMSIDVGHTADEAFVDVTEGTVNLTVDRAYSASVVTHASTTTVSGGKPDAPGPPPGASIPIGERNDTTVQTVEPAGRGAGAPSLDGFHELRAYDRTVTLRHERERLWVGRGGVVTTRSTSTERVRVTVALLGKHTRNPHVPRKGIETVHEHGGPFDGPNLADVPAKAEEAVVEARGGPDELAADAATGSLGLSHEVVRGDRPDGLRRWLLADLAGLRERVRNVSVDVSRDRLGTFEAAPARALADEIRSREDELVDVPATYGSVSEKARVAVRSWYVSEVVTRLELRARHREERKDSFADALDESGVTTLGGLRQANDARRAADRTRQADGPLPMAVDGAPPYLTVTGIDSSRVSAIDAGDEIHPMTARNTNLAGVPFADVAASIIDSLLPGAPDRRTELRTAAVALRAANRTAERTTDGELDARRSTLRRAVQRKTAALRADLRDVLKRRSVGDDRGDREAIVEAGLGRWDTVHGRAIALTNDSAAEAIAATAARERPGDVESANERDELAVRLRVALTDALDEKGSKPAGAVVNETTDLITERASERIGEVADEELEKQLAKSASRVPAGLMVTPVPGYWYATTNAWVVTVRGRYERFAVETVRRTAAAGDASLNYVRDGSNVTFDADGDGESELFGRADRVSFAAQTAAIVVVPPGGSGVGDVDGELDEKSPGWPEPGPGDGASPGDAVRDAATEGTNASTGGDGSEGRQTAVAGRDRNAQTAGPSQEAGTDL